METLSASARRRLLIDLARRRIRPGSGSHIQFLNKRTTTMKWLDLANVLSPVPFAVVGAVATRLYMPERVTQDLNIIISIHDVAAVHEKLIAAGFKKTGTLTIGGASWEASDGCQIDILEGKEEWWPGVIKTAQSNRDAQGFPIIPLPFLVLMKYHTSRLQDLADISRMLGQANAAILAEVRTLFAKYMPDEQDDLESLIQLGQLEFQQKNG
jgi:hypothetical protein